MMVSILPGFLSCLRGLLMLRFALRSMLVFSCCVVVLGWNPRVVGQAKGPPPPPPQSPSLNSPANLGVSTGSGVTDLTLTGGNLAGAIAVLCPAEGVTFTIPPGQTDAGKLQVKVEAKPNARIGTYPLRVATNLGVSNIRPFSVDALPLVPEKADNTKRETAQELSPPCVVTGAIAAESSDFFKLKVQPGQMLTIEVLARRIGSPLDPVLILYDAKSGRELPGLYADDTPGLQTDARITHTFKEAAEVIVELRDSTYRGSGDYTYRLRVGEFPGVTTAYPLAVTADQPAKVTGTGPLGDTITPVDLKAKAPVAYVTPRFGNGLPGWPVPVLVHTSPEQVEQEPNNDAGSAQKVPVPVGITGRFASKGDFDYFRFPAKKGEKLELVAQTYAFNSPAEVYLRVLDDKGAELGKSNPTQPVARIEFTAPADGEFLAVAEQLNYLHGPHEVYHLAIRPVVPDFEVVLGFDRVDLAPGGVSGIPIVGLVKQNGFNAPVELSIVGIEGISGSLTLPAGANPTPQAPIYIPVQAKTGVKPGAYPVQVQAVAKIGEKNEERFATFTDIVRGGLAGLPNVPRDWTDQMAAVVIADAPFSVELKMDALAAAPGASAKGKAIVKRSEGFDEEVQLALFGAPGGVTLQAKPIAKGANETEVVLAADGKAAISAGPVLVRVTAKVKGKDFAYFAWLPEFKVVAPPKKDEPKKDEKDKKQPPPPPAK